MVTEEHSVNGGLGEACSRVLAESGVSPRFKVVALPDEHTVNGSQDEILGHYGISPEGLDATMKHLQEES